MKEYYKQIIKPDEKRLYKGLDSFTNKTIGRVKTLLNRPSKLRVQAKKIFDLSFEYEYLDEERFAEKVSEYKNKFRLQKIKSDEEFHEAFALAVEAAFRILNKRAYIVQIMGALALVKGYAIEMSTGEGKTLTATIAAIALAWRGKPVHIITSNDYLAKRDAENMREVYRYCSISVGHVIGTMRTQERRENYSHDITYTTSKEVLADFLRDRMLESQEYNINNLLINKITNKSIPTEYVLRGLAIAIIDEADSVLSDEATTPLIISAQGENKILKESTALAYEIASSFVKERDYTVHERYHEIVLTKEGSQLVKDKTATLAPIWHQKDRREFLIKQALLAKEVYHLHKHYVIVEGKILIVDEKTGRVMHGRSWGNGLHQAIEAKERVEITDPTTTFSKMSFQRFFRFYKHLCGMSGTLHSLSHEFWDIYNLSIIKIPTRLQSKMNILPERIFLNHQEKIDELIEYIKLLTKKRVPVLVGTQSIKESEELSMRLMEENIQCATLNALHDELEAEIIKEAGLQNRVTIATNMAGRGTDISISPEVDAIGGLHVIITQKDTSKRIDFQFYGRAARQGQNGEAVAFLSLEDEMLNNYLPKKLKLFFESNIQKAYVKKIIARFYRHYQNRIQRETSIVRQKRLFQEFDVDDSMSFTLRA